MSASVPRSLLAPLIHFCVLILKQASCQLSTSLLFFSNEWHDSQPKGTSNVFCPTHLSAALHLHFVGKSWQKSFFWKLMKLLLRASCSRYSVSANTVNQQVKDRKSFLFLCLSNFFSCMFCFFFFFPIQTQLSKAQEETGALKLRLQAVSIYAFANCRRSNAFASAVALLDSLVIIIIIIMI